MKPGLPVWRSLLYVPVNVEKYVEKAHTRGADCILLDLEDSVPPTRRTTRASSSPGPRPGCGAESRRGGANQPPRYAGAA